MEKLDEQLNNIPKMEVPVTIHQSIMRKINYQKVKSVLFIVLALLIINFLIMAWHINAKLIEAEFTDMTQDFFEVFSFSFSFLNSVLENFFEVISPELAISAVLSLIGVIYMIRKIKYMRR